MKSKDNFVKALLDINNIEVIYDHVILVLKGISLHVNEGQIVALLGANGAGKTTTLKAVSNLLYTNRNKLLTDSNLLVEKINDLLHIAVGYLFVID